MELKDIIKLIDRLETSSLTHVSVEKDGEKIVLKKEKELLQSVAPIQSAPVVAATPKNEPILEIIEEVAVENDSNITYITSPIVGTFYESPNPTADAFVKVGDNINKGQVLCIVEAMKLMNEIEADFSGEILEILVKNEEMVEFGQNLFKVRLK